MLIDPDPCHRSRPSPPLAVSRLGIAREAVFTQRRIILNLEAKDAQQRKYEQTLVSMRCAIAKVLELAARALQHTAQRFRPRQV